jgi:hypothetical protein
MIDLLRAGEDFNYQCPEERAKGYNCYKYVSDLRSPLDDAQECGCAQSQRYSLSHYRNCTGKVEVAL